MPNQGPQGCPKGRRARWRAAQARASRAVRKKEKERMEAAAAAKTLTLFSFRNPVMEDDESAEPILVPFKPGTGERRVNSKPS